MNRPQCLTEADLQTIYRYGSAQNSPVAHLECDMAGALVKIWNFIHPENGIALADLVAQDTADWGGQSRADQLWNDCIGYVDTMLPDWRHKPVLQVVSDSEAVQQAA